MRINPVYKKELKMMARSMQLPVLAVVYNAVLIVVAVIVLYCIGRVSHNNGTAPYEDMMMLYMLLLTIEAGLLCLFVPSAAGGSIAGERERQTLDILLASKMTVPGIIIGKMLSCVSLAILLVVSSAPVLAIVLMYGGISPIDIYQSIEYVGFFIVMIGCIGVFCSCRFKKTTFASIASYGILIFLTVGTGMFVILMSLAFHLSNDSDGVMSAGPLIYLWLLNPAVTYIMILFRQINDIGGILGTLRSLGAAPDIVRHWIGISVVVQFIFMVILIVLAAKYLNPVNERFQAGVKILKKHKRA